MPETNATNTRSKSVFMELMPRQHVSIRCSRNQCQSNMFNVDIAETNTKTTVSSYMCAKQLPQQHFKFRCSQNQCHTETNARATFSNSMFTKQLPQQCFQSRQARQKQCHSNITIVDMPEINATTALNKSMSLNLRRNDMFNVSIPQNTSTATFLNSTVTKIMPHLHL